MSFLNRFFDWIDRGRELRYIAQAAREEYRPRHSWTITGTAWTPEILTPPLTREEALQYVKRTLGESISLVDDDRYLIVVGAIKRE